MVRSGLLDKNGKLWYIVKLSPELSTYRALQGKEDWMTDTAIESDVLVFGGGGAGFRAAIGAREKGANALLKSTSAAPPDMR